ncbi:DUF935 family protein [Pseudomonas aeruginosa]|nr:DUF935 family protein [Pseudomonas aeruginosa]
MAAPGYMCKAWSWKDWMAFADLFGIPMRVGRYGPGASQDDVAVLMAAVANLGSDAAAVIPDSMRIEFQQAVQVSGAADFFERLAEWWDKQISKGVLGQTMSVDDGSSRAQAEIHNEVRLDLLQADARALSNTLNRALVRPYCDLNFAPGRGYPRLVIVVPKPENTALLVDALEKLVPLGLEVEQSVIRDKLNLPEPAAGAKLLQPAAPAAEVPLTRQKTANSRPGWYRRGYRRQPGPHPGDGYRRPAGRHDRQHLRAAGQRLQPGGVPRQLIETYPEMNAAQLADAMADGLAAASLAGRYDVLRGL